MTSESEMTVIYGIPYSEFKDWADKHLWICIHQSERDFGEKQSSHHSMDTTVLRQIYNYLTPLGINVAVLVENGKVKSASTNITY